MVVQNAIIVKNAKKRYSNDVTILDGLNLKVPKGSIYGLLGPSGCGKTTLLSCVVGVRKLDSGELWVLGGNPGTKESGIPGPRIGYMPQDISLIDEFTIIGALYFFGRINGMEDYMIDERYKFLKDLLQLPPKNRLVKNISGGQQRRVSFAAAMLHNPELLILDEPTVGLDPVLRDNIWNHLVKMTKEDEVTVIITTHYIEEAKQADTIGLMRYGKLLIEASPRHLLEQGQSDSLEEVFLKLSEQQKQNMLSNNSMPQSEVTVPDTFFASPYSKLQSSRKKRCHALLVKNGLQFLRNPGGVLFSLLLPILQMTLFYNAIGLEPKDMTISVVNEEAGNCNDWRYYGNVTNIEDEGICSLVDSSCRFLNRIKEGPVDLNYYENYDDALDDVKSTSNIGIMHFRRNFSSSLQNLIDDPMSMSDANILQSHIHIMIYNPDKQISTFAMKVLSENFFDELEEILKECGIPPRFGNIPLRFEDPIFGTKDQSYASFVAPPFVLTLVFILATSVTSSIIINDRHSGVWDRILVQGVTTAEILATHLISQVIVIMIQVAVAMSVYFFHYDTCKGSIATIIWLAMLAGLCGMSYGFFISVMCTSHALVNYASTGSFYPLLLLCGMIWPIEGIPKGVRWFSVSLPLTMPGVAIREVFEKGSSISDPDVYTGFLVVSAWILIFISICLFRLRF